MLARMYSSAGSDSTTLLTYTTAAFEAAVAPVGYDKRLYFGWLRKHAPSTWPQKAKIGKIALPSHVAPAQLKKGSDK